MSSTLLNCENKREDKKSPAQSAGAVEYIDCIFAEG